MVRPHASYIGKLGWVLDVVIIEYVTVCVTTVSTMVAPRLGAVRSVAFTVRAAGGQRKLISRVADVTT
jgi:hypothetical protein